MASRTLTVVAKVKDAASAGLNKISKSFQDTGKSAQKTSVNFTEFNRILFSTTAFVGTFTRAFDAMNQALVGAGDLDRLSQQFEMTVGPKGDLFKAINSMTKNSIDRMEAMRSGISLQTLGITKDTRQLAEVIARAGTAAKRAGFNSAEGIKRVTDFLKDGSISSLSFLNVLSSTNPALQAQMSVLQRYGGVMGTVVSTQAKLRIGMAALRAATSGMENDTRDLADIMSDLSQSFSFVKSEGSLFLGKALSPILEKIIDANFSVSSLIERVRTFDKTLLTTIKNFAIIGASLASVVGTLGTARLVFKALGALGIGGVPMLTAGLLGLAASFTDVQKAVEPFMKIMKNTGAVLLGTSQLVSSFIHDSDNFAKGIGKMDSELHAFLEKEGLLEFTKNLARAGATIITFTKDVGSQLVDWLKMLGEFIDPLMKKISAFFAQSNPTGWARSWIEGSKGVRGGLVQITAGAVAAFAAFKGLGLARNILSKVPVIGGMFGGGGAGRKGPAGTPGDPIYTRDVSAALGGLGGLTGVVKTIFAVISNPLKSMGAVITALGETFNSLLFLSRTLAPVIGQIASKFAALAVIFTAGAGFASGLLSGAEYLTGFVSNVMNLAGATFNFVSTMLKTNETFNKIYDSLSETAKMFIDFPMLMMQEFFNAFKELGGATSTVIGMIGNKIGEWSNTINNKTAAEINAKKSRSLSDLGLSANAQGKVGIASTPEMPGSEAEKIAMAQDAISRLEGHEKVRMSESLKMAMEGTSAGGAAITPEEWKIIFREAMNEAEITKDTKQVANKPEKTMPIRTQRC